MLAPRVSGRLRGIAVALAICGATAAFAQSASAAPAVKTSNGWKTTVAAWGVNDGMLGWNLDDAALAPRVAAIKKLNARWVRFGINWARIQEGGPGTYRWTEVDRMVARLAFNGIRWRPTLMDPPAWLKAYPDVDMRQPATSSARVGEFLDAFLDRYGPNGTLWAENTWVPKVPVLDVELHNEPNTAYFWGFDPAIWSIRTDFTGEGWAKLYGPAADTVKAQHSSVRLWMGGLVHVPSSPGVSGATFIRNAFTAHPKLRNTLSGVALHVYAFNSDAAKLVDPRIVYTPVAQGVAAMRTYGRSTMKVQINEFGSSQLRVPNVQNRADILTTVADLARSDCPIDGFSPYTSIDYEDDPNNLERWYGLVSKASGELYGDGAAYTARVAAYNAGTVKGTALDVC